VDPFRLSSQSRKDLLRRIKTVRMHWLIGNDCQPVKRQDGSTWYKWRVFIDPGAEGISWVRRAVAHLHPSFHPSTIPLQPGPSTTATSASSTMPSPSAIWTEARTGWGTFEVQLEVEVAPPMGDASTLRLTHHLDFTTALCTHTIEPKLPFHPPLPPQPLHPPQTPHPWVGGVERMAVALEQQPFLEHDSPAFFHGRLLAQGGADGCGALLPPPKCTWRCAKPPRDDHEAPEWLTGSEFEDEETALACKLSALASLLRGTSTQFQWHRTAMAPRPSPYPIPSVPFHDSIPWHLIHLHIPSQCLPASLLMSDRPTHVPMAPYST